MKKRLLLLAGFGLLCFYGLTAEHPRVEALEIGRDNLDDRPSGKEADGLPGDFVLRNDRIELLIGGNLPLRRANMTTDYRQPIPGAIFDLDLRSAGNDQLTAFRPGDSLGRMSYVKIAEDDGSGSAVVEAVRTAASGDGLAVRHEYRLEEDAQYVLVTSTYRNEGEEPREITPRAVFRREDEVIQAGSIRTLDSVDPHDKRGFAWAPLDLRTLPETKTLEPGVEKTYRVALAVGRSPLAAYGVIAALLDETGVVKGQVVDPSGDPAIFAEIVATLDGAEIRGYPNDNGNYRFELPEGEHELTLHDIGREGMTKAATVQAGEPATIDWNVSKASKVTGLIRDAAGGPSPAKIQFLGRNGTKTPDFGSEYRVHGYSHQYQTHDGRFEQQIPPGDYLVRITHGPEYNLVERNISVGEGETVDIQATVRRTVDTSGWVSTDFHAHSTPSGDNYCNTDDRLINFAAEQLEFIPTTEHNRIYDWAPHIKRLGLSGRLKTVPGIELTGSGQHFNSFPLTPDPLVQDGGAPVWAFDPRINAVVLRNWGTPTLSKGSRYDLGRNARGEARERLFGGGPDRWVQANHPQVQQVFFDRDADGVRDGGFVGLEKLVDAAEVWSSEILNHQPMIEWRGREEMVPNRTFFWLQMLNQGRHVWCVAVSDAHRIFGNGVGDWRTFVPSSTDEPAEIDHAEIIRNAKAGRMMISNGPFLEVETADGAPIIGSTIRSEGAVELKIRVQAPNWVDLDRVQILVNGRMPDEFNFTAEKNPKMFRNGVVRFEETVTVPLQQDAHLIVAAVDEESNLFKGWGLNPQGRMAPTAFTNPIYIDVDGNGFQANGDTLGHPLPTAAMVR